MRDVRGNTSVPRREWHEVEADDHTHAANIVGRKAKFVSIHGIHNVDSDKGKKTYDSAVHKVNDIARNHTPAFSDHEKKTLFHKAKEIVKNGFRSEKPKAKIKPKVVKAIIAKRGRKKKSTLPTFGGTVLRKKR